MVAYLHRGAYAPLLRKPSSLLLHNHFRERTLVVANGASGAKFSCRTRQRRIKSRLERKASRSFQKPLCFTPRKSFDHRIRYCNIRSIEHRLNQRNGTTAECIESHGSDRYSKQMHSLIFEQPLPTLRIPNVTTYSEGGQRQVSIHWNPAQLAFSGRSRFGVARRHIPESRVPAPQP